MVQIDPEAMRLTCVLLKIEGGEGKTMVPVQQEEVKITRPVTELHAEILTQEAARFLVKLASNFEDTRQELLRRRRARQQEISEGRMPDFLPEAASIREAEWKVAPIPRDLLDRRVEITGPTERKMIINALNSGASVFMADFEDANSPTWDNVVAGQCNLMDAVRRTISFQSDAGKRYALNPTTATLMVRPRGFHLPERHVEVDGQPAPAMLVDFGLYFFHNAAALRAAGTGPYFYLPKMQSHLEARLWNHIFVHAQQALDIPRHTIKATVLIETLPAAFEMDEILYELKDHIVGLN